MPANGRRDLIWRLKVKTSELTETCVKKQSVKFIDFSRFILPYGPFPLPLIRTDVSSKPPISNLIPRSGSGGATCFYKLVSVRKCQCLKFSDITTTVD
jgi:hypothetical protein